MGDLRFDLDEEDESADLGAGVFELLLPVVAGGEWEGIASATFDASDCGRRLRSVESILFITAFKDLSLLKSDGLRTCEKS